MQSSNIIQNQAALTVITAYKIYNSVVRRRKDSSLEIYVGLMVSIAITSNKTLVQLPQLVLLHGTAISSGLLGDEKSISRCWTFITQSDISFLRTREPPEPQECLMEKPLNFLQPLANYEGCSRNYARGWAICYRNVWPHKPGSMMPETFSVLAQKGITLDTSCLLTMCYFGTPRELPTKVDIAEDSALNGEHQGNHKRQMRGSLYASPYCEY